MPSKNKAPENSSASDVSSAESDYSQWPELRPLEIRHVIRSRGRGTTITTHKLIPSATLVVPASQADSYAHTGCEIVTTRDDLLGLGNLNNWLLDHFTERCLIIWDDDVTACVRLMSMQVTKLNPNEMKFMTEATARCAQGAGAALFGWNQRPSPLNVIRNQPYGINKWCGGVLGVIGRDIRWDGMLRCKADIDCCLRELLLRRVVWTDNRYSFIQKRDLNLGGCAKFRSKEAVDAEKAYIKKKWRSHVLFENSRAGNKKTGRKAKVYASQDTIVLNVSRRQSASGIPNDEGDALNLAVRQPTRTQIADTKRNRRTY
jgi:hypothetical protein